MHTSVQSNLERLEFYGNEPFDMELEALRYALLRNVDTSTSPWLLQVDGILSKRLFMRFSLHCVRMFVWWGRTKVSIYLSEGVEFIFFFSSFSTSWLFLALFHSIYTCWKQRNKVISNMNNIFWHWKDLCTTFQWDVLQSLKSVLFGFLWRKCWILHDGYLVLSTEWDTIQSWWTKCKNRPSFRDVENWSCSSLGRYEGRDQRWWLWGCRGCRWRVDEEVGKSVDANASGSCSRKRSKKKNNERLLTKLIHRQSMTSWRKCLEWNKLRFLTTKNGNDKPQRRKWGYFREKMTY